MEKIDAEFQDKCFDKSSSSLQPVQIGIFKTNILQWC